MRTIDGIRPLTLAVIGAALLNCCPAAAEFLFVDVRDVSEEVGAPSELRTWRLYAIFDDPLDQVLAVAGDPDYIPVEFRTNDPDGLFNDGGAWAGLKQEDFPTSPIGALWDSYVTIAATNLFDACCPDYSPDFLGSNGIDAVIVGSSWLEDFGGWFDSKPGTPETGVEVAIAQFTVGRAYGVRLSGLVAFHPSGIPPIVFRPFCATSANHPSCSCPADVDLDGTVDSDDQLIVLSTWGPCDGACPGDVDLDGTVGFNDLLAVLSTWGPCP